MFYFQCIIPVFHNLLPQPHDRKILRLLFVFAHWHGLAKLRMHTDATLAVLDDVTTELGEQLRAFKNTCTNFPTCELRREADARKRRQAAQVLTGDPSTLANGLTPRSSQRQPRTLNLQTYKVHALGDYVATIKMYGTTDSYTTAIVSSRVSHELRAVESDDL